MTLAYDDKVRIQKEVVLGLIPPANESEEAIQFRNKIVLDFKKAQADGHALSLPNDWD